jgi:hypothetical protein
MKQILSLFMFGIGALLFLAFFATLKPTDVTAASGQWRNPMDMIFQGRSTRVFQA